MKKLSIVVPALNEEKNIPVLLERINRTLTEANIEYEVIIVDDRSTDNTVQVTKNLSPQFPVRLHRKQGPNGKAQALLEGFAIAQYPVIGMIDADLQYPPEAFPLMLNKLSSGFDIVVANRREAQTSKLRKLSTFIFKSIFIKAMHRLDIDSQSGLKVFKKIVIENMTLKPAPWSFDLEFLTKARNAGYKSTSIDIDFADRVAGKSKVGLLNATMQLSWESSKLWYKGNKVAPLATKDLELAKVGYIYKGTKFIHHTQLDPEDSAVYRISTQQKTFMLAFAGLLLLSLILSAKLTAIVLISGLILLYFADLLFNFYLIHRSYMSQPEIDVTPEQLQAYDNFEWPTYTIFCPLYKEWEVIPQFTESIAALDYPKSKLQVMLLLEEDDIEGVEKIKAMDLPKYFEIIVVPHSLPKTKPKACNYGLKFAKGEYCVIYDAEDAPEPEQLKKAVIAFQLAPKNTMCVQAKLNFYNPYQNLLTRLFTMEYSLWFDLVLTGLQSINAPIPLGGTSNHFKTQDVRDLGAWDAFSVTEDADLGMRIAKLGYITTIVNSTTYEEANSDYLNWYKQRIRWIKGYMQTYLVHTRSLGKFSKTVKKPDFLTFQLIVGGKVLSMLVNPLMWLMTIFYFGFRPIVGPFIESLFITPIFYIAAFTLVIGNFLYMYYYMMGTAKRGQWPLVKYTLLVPIYWLMMSVCAISAVWELLVKPYHWNKTKHGLHLKKQLFPTNPAPTPAYTPAFADGGAH